ncbi:MAG: rhodanese-like domain-containing protein [Flavobacteriales bacterium]|nr:rhodanese-like domain-containing protein [Flavobacteriales bacterium]
MKDLTKQMWKEQIANDANAVILDVRTEGEWSEGVQPNAQLLNFLDGGSFMAGIEKLDKSKNYYVYCRSGGRSSSACSVMEGRGFTTYNLIGGMMSWDGEVVAPTY